MEWVGFSDEELRRMKRDTDPNQHDGRLQMNARPARGRSSAARGRAAGRDRPSGAQFHNLPNRNFKDNAITQNLPPEARLSQPQKPQPLPQEQKQQQHKQQEQKQHQHQQRRRPPPTNAASHTPDNTQNAYANTPSSVKVTGERLDGSCNGKESEQKKEEDEDEDIMIDEKDIIVQELHNLEKFQFQQKRIEEQNKMKRQLLTSAICERQKLAKQEATRLVQIQKELAQLDQLLAIDVSIIRNKIEEASREFMDAQRRYERAEREFIESKTDLHHKCEIKDSLTEHLHLVIHQNEVRKARKLTSLMVKLSLPDGAESEGGELSEPTPSGILLTSIQNTHEQRRMLERLRRRSGEAGGTRCASLLSRAGSEGNAAGGGLGGWISSWILGSEAGDAAADKGGEVGAGEAGRFKDAGEASIVTTAPVTVAAAGSGGVVQEAAGASTADPAPAQQAGAATGADTSASPQPAVTPQHTSSSVPQPMPMPIPVPPSTTAAPVPQSTATSVPQSTGAPVPQSTTTPIPQSTTTVSVPQSTTAVSVPQSTTATPIPQSIAVPVPQSTTAVPVPQSTTVKPVPQSTATPFPQSETKHATPSTAPVPVTAHSAPSACESLNTTDTAEGNLQSSPGSDVISAFSQLSTPSKPADNNIAAATSRREAEIRSS